jgi:CheY-like chemotaxis protein
MGFLDKLVGNSKTKQVTAPLAPPKKVIVVEDDKELRDFYSELLTSEGFVVLTAENGQLGLQTITAQKPDLVLLDLMMPVMDGKMMLHKMRNIPEFAKTPVIILTNAGDADNMRQTQYFDNANAFLIKANVSPEEIINRVKTFI